MTRGATKWYGIIAVLGAGALVASCAGGDGESGRQSGALVTNQPGQPVPAPAPTPSPAPTPTPIGVAPGTTPDQPIDGPLADLPDDVKQSDFRITPPVVTQTVATLADDGKSTTLLIDFASDSRIDQAQQITLSPDGQSFVLNRVSDTTFSITVPIDFQTVQSEQNRLRQAAAAEQTDTIPVFSNREQIDAIKLAPISSATSIPLIPHLPFHVHPDHSLFITATSVVEDPTRTFNPCSGVGTPMGVWTFGRLMSNMAGTNDPAVFTLKWLQTWLSTQTVSTNGLTIAPRPNMNNIISGWPKLSDGRLDLARSPLKLVAIVNRIDLAGNATYGAVSGAEGRFIFEVLDPKSCSPQRFFVILEYGVPRRTCTALRDWAHQWLNLETLAVGSSAFNSALEAITQQFAGAGADPTKPNKSALNQLRTDEIAIAPPGQPWELREFHLLPNPSTNALLTPFNVKQTPDRSYNGVFGGANAPSLATFINTRPLNATVPFFLPFAPGGPFLGASTTNTIDFWNAPGIAVNSKRFNFSLNTCNGCHGRETNTGFTHVSVVPFGTATMLSAFLTGETVTDPVVSTTSHVFHDLIDRGQKLQNFANASCGFVVGPIADPIRSLVFIDPRPPMVFAPNLQTD